jgi:sugar O-acyltransferase (sialic acid O-acetyltransferase NeuD family)
MDDLYIVGAGGFGREVYHWLKDEVQILKSNSFCGFLDDSADALEGFEYACGVVAPITGFEPKGGDVFICALGGVAQKERLCGQLIQRGARFLTLVHPTVVLGGNVKLGDGVVLCPRVTLTCDIEVGAMAMINCHATVGHDVRIGEWSTISAHCDLTGHTQLGKSVFLGSGARVIPSKSVGDGALVGAGSVVIRSVKAGQKVFGNPARVF